MEKTKIQRRLETLKVEALSKTTMHYGYAIIRYSDVFQECFNGNRKEFYAYLDQFTTSSRFKFVRYVYKIRPFDRDEKNPEVKYDNSMREIVFRLVRQKIDGYTPDMIEDFVQKAWLEYHEAKNRKPHIQGSHFDRYVKSSVVGYLIKYMEKLNSYWQARKGNWEVRPEPDLDSLLMADSLKVPLDNALKTLKPKEEYVLRREFGLPVYDEFAPKRMTDLDIIDWVKEKFGYDNIPQHWRQHLHLRVERKKRKKATIIKITSPITERARIAVELDSTYEGIRQLSARGRRRLRHASRRHFFKDFVVKKGAGLNTWYEYLF